MVVTVELSMYPFREDYREAIKGFIARLNEYEELNVATGDTSTVIFGEQTHVMQTLSELMQWSHGEHGRSVFVAKFLPGYEPQIEHLAPGYRTHLFLPLSPQTNTGHNVVLEGPKTCYVQECESRW